MYGDYIQVSHILYSYYCTRLNEIQTDENTTTILSVHEPASSKTNEYKNLIEIINATFQHGINWSYFEFSSMTEPIVTMSEITKSV